MLFSCMERNHLHNVIDKAITAGFKNKNNNDEITKFGFSQVVQCSDVPLVRLFVPSEEDESALVNVAELIGLESEIQADFQEKESTSAGYMPFSITL